MQLHFAVCMFLLFTSVFNCLSLFSVFDSHRHPTACMCHLTFEQGQMTKLYNPHASALRASLFLRTQQRKQRLSLSQWGENKEMEEYEISNPPRSIHTSVIFTTACQ